MAHKQRIAAATASQRRHHPAWAPLIWPRSEAWPTSAQALGCPAPWAAGAPCGGVPRGTSSFAQDLLAVRNFGSDWIFDGNTGPLPEKFGFGKS
jgi:hypothetical protein